METRLIEARGHDPLGPREALVVQVRDVFVAYPGAAGSVMALRGSDLTLAVGERLLVQGPNGSGKSTLLRVITGEQPVVAGTVVVSGTALHELTAGQRREWRARSVGFVDQFAGRGLLPELSVVQNVALQLRLTGVPQAKAEQRARETCARLEVDRLLDRPVQQLSGGEAQRVAVCAAVAHEPQLLLADEPTGELDERSAGEVYDLLARIAADGTGVILVSHDPRAVASTDRAVRIRDGRAAEQWRPGSAVVEQLPDSRGWIRVPRERHPELDPVPPLEARRTDERSVARPSSSGRSRARPAVADAAGARATRRTRCSPAWPVWRRATATGRSSIDSTCCAVRDVDGRHRSVRLGQIDPDVGARRTAAAAGRDGHRGRRPVGRPVARCPGRAPPPMGGAAAPAAGHARGAHRTREPAAHRGHPRVPGEQPDAGADRLAA